MNRILVRYLDAVARGVSHADAVREAADRLAADPWDVVHQAGALARCRLGQASKDTGITERLEHRSPTGRGVVAVVPRGAPIPIPVHRDRRRRGAYDTPRELAVRLARATVAASTRPVRVGLDPACGTGAFLLAMHEAGVPALIGSDLDALALEVCRRAVPSAQLIEVDGLLDGPSADVVCGNPPFVPPERQGQELRQALRRRFPWLHGRFDLVIPFAAMAVDRVEPGGACGLVLPTSALVQPYGAQLRRRWVSRHRIALHEGPLPFPGAAVDVSLIVVVPGAGPAPVPPHGIAAEDLLELDRVPLSTALLPGDLAIARTVRGRSFRLGDFCLVDTGVVSHGAHGGRDTLLHDTPGQGRVPYADARDFFAGQIRWLEYRPDLMHRAKTPSMFERPKVVVQRLRGRGPVRAALDDSGTYVGHTCTVVQSKQAWLGLDAVLRLVTSPLVDAITRIEQGQRLDLYPRDVAGFPIPRVWQSDPQRPLAEAFGLTADEVGRLCAIAAVRRPPG